MQESVVSIHISQYDVTFSVCRLRKSGKSMPISLIWEESHPAEFKVVGMATLALESEDKSARNLLRPTPPVMTETPDTWAFIAFVNRFAPAT